MWNSDLGEEDLNKMWAGDDYWGASNLPGQSEFSVPFEVGDRVKIKDDASSFLKGQEGVVREINWSTPPQIVVQTDEVYDNGSPVIDYVLTPDIEEIIESGDTTPEGLLWRSKDDPQKRKINSHGYEKGDRVRFVDDDPIFSDRYGAEGVVTYPAGGYMKVIWDDGREDAVWNEQVESASNKISCTKVADVLEGYKSIWDAAIEDARRGNAPRPVMLFASKDEIEEYTKAYSRALATVNRQREFFGDQKWWVNPRKEWDETQPLWTQNIHTRPGGHHFRRNIY